MREYKTVHLPPGLLRSISKPARYVGGEWNSVHKTSEEGLIRFAFCFPDLYEIGMSNQALQILYGLLNRRPDTWCERAFAPWPDMEQGMRQLGLPLYALESFSPLAEFDFLGFTLQYELSFTNVLNMLDMAGVPLEASQRQETDPLVIAGGPVVFNAEPIAPAFDLILMGESEELVGELIGLYRSTMVAGKRPTGWSREDFLLKAAGLPGVYVPAFYDVSYKEDGTVAAILPNRPGVPASISKRIVLDLDQVSWPKRQLVPNMEIIHDRIFLELFRGCPRGCRFCQAGMIYRPMREKSPDTLVRQATALADSSGYDEIGLLSLSTSDYLHLGDLTDELLEQLGPRQINLSLPSLRLDSFSFALMDKVSRTRKSGLTFAPEAGSQRLRDVVNKNISEEDLLGAMELAFSGGWDGAKLYFMLGLPTETDEDVLAIADLLAKVAELFYSLPRQQRPRRLAMTVSTAAFVPKPHTPFQWEGQLDRAGIIRRQQLLKDNLDRRNVKYQWHAPDSSFLEAVLSRGDRRLFPVLVQAWRQGQIFTAWDEKLDLAAWLEAFASHNLEPEFYANRKRPLTEVLPWSHLDCGVSPDFFQAEYARALTGATTEECRVACSACGAERFEGGICFDC